MCPSNLIFPAIFGALAHANLSDLPILKEIAPNESAYRSLTKKHPLFENLPDKLHQDEFVVMPNHIHGIIWIIDGKATHRVAPTNHPRGLKPGSLGSIIGQYKSITTKRINQIQNTPGIRVWQRNYYDRVIRNDKELDAIRQYIQTNPENRKSDLGLPIRHRDNK